MKNLYSDAAHAFHFMIRQLAMMALSICYTLPQQVHLITRTCNLKLYALNARIYIRLMDGILHWGIAPLSPGYICNIYICRRIH